MALLLPPSYHFSPFDIVKHILHQDIILAPLGFLSENVLFSIKYIGTSNILRALQARQLRQFCTD